MIKAKINGKKVDLKMSGDIQLLLTDTVVLINSIHQAISEKNQQDADAYRHCIKTALEIDLPFVEIEDIEEAVVDTRNMMEGE